MAGSIVKLASQILEHATKYEGYFTSQGLTAPGLDSSSFPEPSLPDNVRAAREAVVEATTDIQALIRGPRDVLRQSVMLHSHFFGIQMMYRYNIATKVPLEGDISYEKLANACQLREQELKRIVRYCITCHFFTEPRKGFVAHTGASKALALSEDVRAWMGVVCDELWPAAAHAANAMQTWPASEEPNQSGFQLAHGTQDSMFDELSKDPIRAQRFARSMSLISITLGMGPSTLINAYPWADFETLVDLGGSHGATSIALAQHYPNLKSTVQDLPETIQSAPQGLDGRVKFMAHDFFSPQPISADIYFLRWILHDWSDKYSNKILQNLIPALKPGARILVNEFCLPEPGMIPLSKERHMRGYDLAMLTIQNSKEREAADWKKLFDETDSRFQFTGIKRVPISSLALIEAVWTGDPQ